MPLPLPQPTEIAARLSAGYEQEFAAVAGPEGVDARSANAPLSILARVQAMGAFDLYLYLQRLAQELMPDTATDDLARHADVWGIARRNAAPASGAVTFTGTNGLVLPSGIEMKLGDVTVVTTAGGTIASGTVTVAAIAQTAGLAGNFPASTALPLVAPIAGLSSQAGLVVAPGFSGGVEQEAEEDWRARILARIRAGVPYGQPGGYAAWASAVPGVAVVAEKPNWVGLGTVGVVVAMGSRLAPTVPTAPELAAVQAALDAERPVTAMVVAVAATLTPVNLSIFLSPDTTATRAAVTEAVALFLASEPGIGGVIERSRLSEAISSAAGEYAHRLDVPAASITLGAAALAVPGTITWLGA
jgi:uncharacterized phage protein gp47/JayE